MTTTNPTPERKRRGPPALGARILAAGASAAATIGMIGAMAAGTPAASEPQTVPAATPSVAPRRIKVVVVVKRPVTKLPARVASAGKLVPAAVVKPPAPQKQKAVTATHGS